MNLEVDEDGTWMVGLSHTEATELLDRLRQWEVEGSKSGREWWNLWVVDDDAKILSIGIRNPDSADPS
jgi:hypothetical protein